MIVFDQNIAKSTAGISSCLDSVAETSHLVIAYDNVPATLTRIPLQAYRIVHCVDIAILHEHIFAIQNVTAVIIREVTVVYTDTVDMEILASSVYLSPESGRGQRDALYVGVLALVKPDECRPVFDFALAALEIVLRLTVTVQRAFARDRDVACLLCKNQTAHQPIRIAGGRCRFLWRVFTNPWAT